MKHLESKNNIIYTLGFCLILCGGFLSASDNITFSGTFPLKCGGIYALTGSIFGAGGIVLPVSSFLGKGDGGLSGNL